MKTMKWENIVIIMAITACNNGNSSGEKSDGDINDGNIDRGSHFYGECRHDIQCENARCDPMGICYEYYGTVFCKEDVECGEPFRKCVDYPLVKGKMCLGVKGCAQTQGGTCKKFSKCIRLEYPEYQFDIGEIPAIEWCIFDPGDASGHF